MKVTLHLRLLADECAHLCLDTNMAVTPQEGMTITLKDGSAVKVYRLDYHLEDDSVHLYFCLDLGTGDDQILQDTAKRHGAVGWRAE